MPEETEHKKKHAHKHAHKHHQVKPHPLGAQHGHHVVNASGHLVGHFAAEEDAHTFVHQLEGTAPGEEEPKAE